MPFPKKEMEDAYKNADPVIFGSFKDEPELFEADGKVQPLYMKIEDAVDDAVLTDIQELVAAIHKVAEFECRHFFVEGWLSAEMRLKWRKRRKT